jgi:hypothetical protein
MKRAVALALGLWLAGCGDDSAPRSAVDCTATEDLILQPIADFEVPPVNGWEANSDGTGEMAVRDVVEIENGGRCGSTTALHVYGGPYSDYGGGLYHGTNDVDPNVPDGEPEYNVGTDASAWDGIVFWARAMPAGRKNIRLDVSDLNTDDFRNDPKKFMGPANPDGCTPNAPEDGPSIGCDKFGSFATLGDEWRAFALDFVEMRQAGWGLQQKRFATEDVWSLNFSFAHGYWDFWIDDVAFFRRKR